MSLKEIEKRKYRERFEVYLKNRDYIISNTHLLSGEAIGYYGIDQNLGYICIPRGFEKLDFTVKQLDVIQKHLFEDKPFKEIASELDVSESSVRNNYKSVCRKLDDIYTSIWWSDKALERAKDVYSKSLPAFGFSDRAVHRLVRKADVTNIKEFLEKDLESYKRIFGSSKLYDEIVDKYIIYENRLTAIND